MNFKKIYNSTFLIIYLFFCYLLFKITIQYIPYNTDVAFLRIKQDYIHLTHYKIAFFIHVYTSIFVLLAGVTQFSNTIQRKYKSIHRSFGWIYIVTTLLLAAPSGLIIGIYANGGVSSQIAFILLAILWFLFTLIALKKAIKKDISSHKKWMIRSFALAVSAITLRAWKYILVYLFHPKPMDVYMIIAWLGWVLNLIIAEYIIYKLNKAKS